MAAIDRIRLALTSVLNFSASEFIPAHALRMHGGQSVDSNIEYLDWIYSELKVEGFLLLDWKRSSYHTPNPWGCGARDYLLPT